ncbi:hypothetical protein AB0J21_08350 [Streptomyces sp. NPDC049954]|uniref:hypothetical protein n=1 Tax=Streptomyces sp. NPDC049954 TaxID=3155779 RepID=UPI003418EE04
MTRERRKATGGRRDAPRADGTEPRGHYATWAKVFAAVVLLVLLPLALWIVLSLSTGPAVIPW